MSKHDIDDLLREALSAEERAAWDELSEATPFELLADSFRQRGRWLDLLGMLMGVVFLGLGVWTLVGLWNATETLVALRWGVGFLMSMWGLWAVKVWSWMQIQRNALSREIKRLELQMVRLGTLVSGQGPGLDA